MTEFCKTCKKCAKHCPSRAISYDGPTIQGPSSINHSGVEKWYTNPEKCFMFWVKNWMDCNNCVRVCPFNKPPGKLHEFVRYSIRKVPVFNRLWLYLDDLVGYGRAISSRKESLWESA